MRTSSSTPSVSDPPSVELKICHGSANHQVVTMSSENRHFTMRRFSTLGLYETDGWKDRVFLSRLHISKYCGVVWLLGVKNADENELRSIASDPDEIHMYNVNDFSFLLDIVDELTINLCNSVKGPGTVRPSFSLSLILSLSHSRSRSLSLSLSLWLSNSFPITERNMDLWSNAQLKALLL